MLLMKDQLSQSMLRAEVPDFGATEGKKVRVADPSVRLEENGWMLLQAGIEVY